MMLARPQLVSSGAQENITADPDGYFLFGETPRHQCTTLSLDLQEIFKTYIGPSAGALTFTLLRKSVVTALRTLQFRSPAMLKVVDRQTLELHQGHSSAVADKYYAPTRYLSQLTAEAHKDLEDAVEDLRSAGQRHRNNVGTYHATRAQASVLANQAYQIALRLPPHYTSQSGSKIVLV